MFNFVVFIYFYPVSSVRRSRSLAGDLPLRRSSRIINKIENNSPEPAGNVRVTRSRYSLVEPEQVTPTFTRSVFYIKLAKTKFISYNTQNYFFLIRA